MNAMCNLLAYQENLYSPAIPYNSKAEFVETHLQGPRRVLRMNTVVQLRLVAITKSRSDNDVCDSPATGPRRGESPSGHSAVSASLSNA